MDIEPSSGKKSQKGQGVPEGFETVFYGLNVSWGKINEMASHTPFVDIGNFCL
jgi:hypothetical protein